MLPAFFTQTFSLAETIKDGVLCLYDEVNSIKSNKNTSSVRFCIQEGNLVLRHGTIWVMSAHSLALVLKAVLFVAVLSCAAVVIPDLLFAGKMQQYKDTISNSGPGQLSNHTLSFGILTDVAPGGYIEFIPPAGFEIQNSINFTERNVELIIDGVPRSIGPVQNATDDLVEIFPGSPGMIRYSLNTTTGINNGSSIQFKVGNHTSTAVPFTYIFSPGVGTTTIATDIKPIKNGPDVGTHEVDFKIYDGGVVASAGFLIAIVDTVGVGPVDSTELIPPLRFNGAPVIFVGGTTQSVELSLETDEFAVCKYSTVAGVAYSAMSNTFTNTGTIIHTRIIPVTPQTSYSFKVRCIDDEGNFNIDDYLIEFLLGAIPTGTPTTTGSTTNAGSGSGTGTSGSGSGSGSGNTSGGSNGSGGTPGSQTGSGGSGGGGGGGSGNSNGTSGGGGFEGVVGPYRSGDGQVTITGFTAPRSAVTFLVDGKIAKTATAGADGEYTVVLDLIARGAYTFGVYSTDVARIKSSTFSTSFTVTGARASNLSNILIPPSILVTPDPVTPGTALTISGYTIPNATVTIENEKEGSAVTRKVFTALSNSSGFWSTAVDTNGYTNGTYKARAKATQASGLQTNFSNYQLYGVGQAANRPLNTDLNRDGKVNLVDFSILLFWWGTAGGDSNPPADINSDAKVNLTDFSILLFNWTG